MKDMRNELAKEDFLTGDFTHFTRKEVEDGLPDNPEFTQSRIDMH